MNAICTKCGKQFHASSVEDAYDPDRLCPECYRAKHGTIIQFAAGSQPELWLSPADESRAIKATNEEADLYIIAMFVARQVSELQAKLKRTEEKLANAFGANKAYKEATPTERARFWAMEAAEQKRRADSAEAQLAALRAEWEAIPTGPLFDYWLGSEAVHPDAADACPDVEKWIKRLYDYVNGEGSASKWLTLRI